LKYFFDISFANKTVFQNQLIDGIIEIIMTELEVEQIIDNFLGKVHKNNNHFLIYSLAIPTNYFDPHNLLEFHEDKNVDFFYMQNTSMNSSLIAINSIFDIKINSKKSTLLLKQEIQKIQGMVFSNYNDLGIDNVPFLVGGMKFTSDVDESEIWTDFSNSDWFVPQFEFVRAKENFYLVLNFIDNPPTKENILFAINELQDSISYSFNNAYECSLEEIETFAFSHWEKSIALIISEIKKNKFKKVVLSRMKTFKIASRVSLANMLKMLSINYPSTTTFAFRRNSSTFFGATPELFLRLENRSLTTDALAGSIKRGENETEDNDLSDYLLSNSKERNEQQFVVDFVINKLSAFTNSVEYNKIPKIKKLANIQHLHTEIKATIRDSFSLFDILEVLYPTPAICGLPVEKAKEMISQSEDYQRGLYSGIIGWMSINSNSELFIGIRSALIKKNLLFIFAGCGIVEGSDALQEFMETEMKFNPILNLFNDEKKH